MAGRRFVRVVDESDLQQRIARAAGDLQPLPKDDDWYGVYGKAHKVMLGPDDLPVPSLARTVLAVIGCRNLGRGEKLAWEYVFRFEGLRCALALQKFGLRFYVDSTDAANAAAAEALAKRFVAAMRKAQRVAEREWLRDLAEIQIRAGDVTVRNQQYRLRQLYEYFREGADLAFDGKGRIPARPPGGGFWLAREATEGFYNTVAMVAGYFSWLEHVMVLSLPFTDFDPESEPLKKFIADRWGLKFKRLWDVGSDSVAKGHYDSLHRVAEEYRNTYGHGGFDKPGATLHFHLPGVGAMPAVLSDISDSPEFNFVPVQADDLARVKSVFDAVDTWLKTRGAPYAMQWIESGYDVRFDKSFRSEASVAMQSPEDFEELLTVHGYFIDQAANMDW